MGNQLSGIAPAQILGAENYFTDLPEFRFESRYIIFFYSEITKRNHYK